ncbi:calpain family cysteine protease containing protein [Stylonychia lemnae]|uniref:Calpain family cysteine protease containing protein n=1 Tax=Stylonychia lemnae TaxID=5949 RepID=A0A078A3Q8_STYLE|nr:calpain family cysteine protease containing protein [Stylonychia lemnae]|eukprot:CDW75384.1 calpain family cysteine protease containing protein [Stylonychia lemnae]
MEYRSSFYGSFHSQNSNQSQQFYQKPQDEMYFDKDFQPNQQSIFNLGNAVDQNRIRYYKTLIWKRTSDLSYSHDIRNELIEPGDVIQGTIGNCYFLSALSSLAQYPQRVLSLFVNLDYAKVGMFIIRLCVNGEFQNVVVDDFIPFDPHSNQPAFTKSRNNKLWPVILEKAWAKIHGGYENSSSGHSVVSFSFLTGAPCSYIQHDDQEKLWDLVKESDKSLHIITASNAKQHLEQHFFEQNGLVNDHVYSLITLNQIKHYGEDLRLVNLRNPWGKQEWNGSWSKFDKKWTPQLQKQLGFQFLKEGEFFMSFFDYFTQFRGTSICKYNESFQRYSIKFSPPSAFITMFEFDIPAGMHQVKTHLILYQTYERIEADWKQQSFHDLVLASYSTIQLKLKKITYNDGTLQAILKSCAFQKSQRKYYTYAGIETSFQTMDLNDSGADYGFYYIHNDSDVAFREMITFVQLQGYKLLPPHSGFMTECTVRPGSSEIIVLKHLDGYGQIQTTSSLEILYDNSQLIALALQKGKQTQIFFQNQAYEIYFYLGSHSQGYMLYFENLTKDVLFKSKFNFEMQNLQLTDDSGKVLRHTEVLVNVGPGKTKYLKLDSIDKKNLFQCRYTYTFRCNVNLADKNEIIAYLRKNGEKTQINYNGQLLQIFYYVGQIGDDFYWYFEHHDQNCGLFEGTYNFKLSNLRLDNGGQFNQWVIQLNRGQNTLRVMYQLSDESREKTSYQAQMKYLIHQPRLPSQQKLYF